ncbi:transglycosylase domain-containing protein [Peribacillus sp. SCS-155]|uniref:transglycosylase domain-containing protein n=1 Tax=Peribacillus sedimenti TaxID=3115297 RepID=UPI003906A264
MELNTGQLFNKTTKYIRAGVILMGIGIAIILLLFACLFIYAKLAGPPPLAVPQSTLYYSSDGTLIGESNNGQKRYWAELEDISPNLVAATISVEDRQFFEHHGFDIKRIGAAVLADISAMSKVQGASTITQQYARNLFLSHDKTWKRKIHEAFYAFRLEMNYSKKEILEGYLNTIYYGHGTYGAEAASQYYFGKSAKKLSIAEASMLAGIPKGPSSFSPFVNMEKAKQRQNIVLSSMVSKGMLTDQAKNKEFRTKLHLRAEQKTEQKAIAPFFQDAVKQALRTQLKMDERTIELGGLRVYTTLDLRQQKIAEKSFDEIISKDSSIQGSLIAMNPRNGQVKALVGGRNYDESSYNRVTQSTRQPGSTIKPLLYYAALEKGFTPSTTLKSELTTFRYDGGKSEYTPHNFNHQYADSEITLAQALALSDNVFAVKTNLFLGEKTLIDTARRFGLTTKVANVPSSALGTSGVKAIEMVNAYSMLANGGKKIEAVFIRKVENHKGEVLFEQGGKPKQVLDPDRSFVLTSMLTGMFDEKLNGYTKVTGNAIIPRLTRTYAGKSGTTEYDSWMIGYTPQLATGVWVGYDQPQKITVPEEKTYAKNIWAQFMEEGLASSKSKAFKPTSHAVGVYIDPSNGLIATDQCPVKRLTYFVEGTEPQEYCTEHIGDGHTGSPNRDHPNEKDNATWYKKFLHLWGR